MGWIESSRITSWLSVTGIIFDFGVMGLGKLFGIQLNEASLSGRRPSIEIQYFWFIVHCLLGFIRTFAEWLFLGPDYFIFPTFILGFLIFAEIFNIVVAY